MYRKLKRTWSNNSASFSFTQKFRKAFPELKKMDSEELCERLESMEVDFYYEEQTPVSFWVRLTLPLALITMIFMFLISPIIFIGTGKWGYRLGEKNRLLNWFKSLKLLS